MRDIELERAQRVVAQYFRSPPAGPYASDAPVLKGENNVGGANIGIPLPQAVQRELLEVTEKDFTGNIRQLQVGENPQYAGNATSLTFNTGSIEVMGARSPDLVRIVIHKLCEHFERCGLEPDICYMSIDNKVTSGSLGYCVAMERMHRSLPGFETMYVPEDFPGIVCTYQHPNRRVVTFLVFEKGRVMALGIEDMYEASEIFLRLRMMCKDFERDATSIQARNASAERCARLMNEERKRGPGRGVMARSKKIDNAVKEFLEENRDRMDDTDFAARLSKHLEGLVEKVADDAPASGARKRAKVADGDTSEHDEDVDDMDL